MDLIITDANTLHVSKIKKLTTQYRELNSAKLPVGSMHAPKHLYQAKEPELGL